MKLNKEELIKKFPYLQKFSDKQWMNEICVNQEMSLKDLSLLATIEMLKDTIKFLDDNKFRSYWEENFSMKVRLTQILSLINKMSQPDIEEMSIQNLEKSPNQP